MTSELLYEIFIIFAETIHSRSTMVYNERDERHLHVIECAKQMMTAARTAPNCGERTEGVPCAMNTIDVGIAVGSACATAADLRLDTRVMYSVGYAALKLGWMPGCNYIIGIPVSASSKNPFFDRKRKVQPQQ